MRYCDTVEEAMKYFLKCAPYNRDGKSFLRRYEIFGRVCEIYKTDGTRGTRPRFRWVEPAPPEFQGVDMIDYMIDYLTPRAELNVKFIPVEVMPAEPLMELDHGQLLKRTDTDYYANLLANLNNKNLFDDQPETTNE